MKAYFAVAVEAVGQKPQHSLTQTWLSRQLAQVEDSFKGSQGSGEKRKEDCTVSNIKNKHFIECSIHFCLKLLPKESNGVPKI